MLKKWNDLPQELQIEAVRPYYDALCKKQGSLFFKRAMDIVCSLLLLIVLSPVFLILIVMIRLDSKGPAFFRQVRVTRYGKHFRIFKFRTMVQNADKIGSQVTTSNDARITRVGRLIRKCRLDEICQLLNVLGGSMTLVGTRPEVPKYVERYTPEMMATLLLPAGVTSVASIRFKDEERLLQAAEDTDRVYVEEVLPQKMAYNLDAIRHFGFFSDFKVLFDTVIAVLKRD
ncbi:MAG: sugar transferase [Clostridia bacterium]|nr:sugar transferase [Clostridia bacterium]